VEVNEFNTFLANDVTFSSLDTDNLATSDELETNNVTLTTYAKKKRLVTSSITGLTLFTSASLLLAGGISLSNSYLGTLPAVSNYTFSLENDGFHYEFDVENEGYLKLYMLLKQDNSEIGEYDFSITNHYKGIIVEGIDVAKNLDVELYTTNEVDYRSLLLTLTMTPSNN